MEFVTGILGIAGGGAAPAAAAGAAGAVGTGSIVGGILQGATSVLSIMMGLGAAEEQATGLELQAREAKQEALDEGVLGVARRSSLRRDLMEAMGERDIAFAASGVDISTGTPAQAREQALSEAERALTIDWGTETSRVARLDERAELLRQKAKKVRRFGLLESLAGGLSTAADIAYRG